MRKSKVKEICQECAVFRTEFFCPAQLAEYRAIPWNAKKCPYGKWRAAIEITTESADQPKDSKATTPKSSVLSEAETRIMTLLVGDITTDVSTIDVTLMQYRGELAALERNPRGCTNCAKGKLLRKYIEKLRPIIHLWKQP